MNREVPRRPAWRRFHAAHHLKSRRWWHGDYWRRLCATLALCLIALGAHAACPPGATDGATVRKGELVLAYRPLTGTGKDAQPGRIPLARHFALEVQLCERDGASVARLLKADATMPAHRHGMNYRPVIQPLESGRFRVAGMMLHMAGHWELVFDVDTGGETVRLTHDVQIN